MMPIAVSLPRQQKLCLHIGYKPIVASGDCTIKLNVLIFCSLVKYSVGQKPMKHSSLFGFVIKMNLSLQLLIEFVYFFGRCTLHSK